jgi:hypothetical protein
MARKIGEGHMEAMGRLGWKELRNAVTPGRESVADTEIGLFGTATQGEIAQDRGSYGLDAEQEQMAGMTQQMQEAPQAEAATPAQETQQEAPQQEGQMSVLGYPLESGEQSHAGRLMEQQQLRGRGR